MRSVGLFPFVVLTSCFVANPRWQGSGEDGGEDGSTRSGAGEDGPGTTLATGTSSSGTTTTPPLDTGAIETQGETMVPNQWWDPAWQYRRRIEWVLPDIGVQVAGLPVQVDVYSLGLPNEFADGGRDIRVVMGDGTVVPVEVDHWSAEAGEGLVWFQAPESNGSDPDLWLYYGNPDINDPVSGDTGVFASGYAAVWHMQESTDSTGKGQTIELSRQFPTEGYIGNGLGLDLATGGVPVNAGPALLGLLGTDFTFSAMIMPGDIQEEMGVLLEVSEADYPLMRIGISQALAVRVTRFEPGEAVPLYVARSEGTLLPGIWQHVTVRHGAGGGTQINIDGFESGVVEDNGPRVPMAPAGQQITIGASIDSTSMFIGHIDEVRVADVLREDEWVQIETDAIALGLAVLGNLEERP